MSEFKIQSEIKNSEIIENRQNQKNECVIQINSNNKSIENKIIESLNIKKIEECETFPRGQYILTPIEVILLNKKMPHGFKFESEENILKSQELLKKNNQKKKISENLKQIKKTNFFYNANKSHSSHKSLSLYDSQINSHKKHNLNTKTNSHIESYIISRKCRKGLDKIKNNQNANFLNSLNDPNSPTLHEIENKIDKNYYTSIYDFSIDLKKLWSYFFCNYYTDEDIYNKTYLMSELSEKICSDLESFNGDLTENYSKIKRRTDNIQIQIEEYKNQKISIEEKEKLRNSIKKLNKNQLIGIINILESNSSNIKMKNKCYEFDIDQLSNKQFKELEVYVNKALSENKNNDENNNNV